MSENRRGGIGVLGLLGVMFIGLKLTHYIDWSWWWVLAPFWGIPAVALVFFAFVFVAGFTVGSLKR